MRRHHLFSLLSVASALSIPPTDDHQAVFNSPAEHGPANLPHSNPTHSFWTHSPGANPLAAEGSTGALTDDADLCIIGSGITGVSAAYHLANAVEQGTFPIPEGETKLHAVILEARDFCSGATGRNGGNLTPFEFVGFREVEEIFGRVAALRYFAIEHYTANEMTRIAREAGWADAVDLVEGGHIDAILTEQDLEELRADFDAAVAAGKYVNVTWLGKDKMNSTYGMDNWGVRGPGYNLWPLKFVTQLFNQAKASTPALDLRLHTRTPVTSVTPLTKSSSRRWALETHRGNVRCSYVLHATNGYASHILPHMAGPTGIIPVRGQVMALRADASLEELTRASWIAKSGYWFPRPAAVNEQPVVILGGAREDAGPPFETYVTDDSKVDFQIGATLRGFLPALFPMLYAPGREPEREWTGIMGYTALNIPFVGPVLDSADSVASDFYQGQFISAGYSGHGMPRAFACAEVVIRMMADEIAGRQWMPPAWFPLPFLTSVRNASPQ